jgi:hypothetical protein
MASDEEGGEGFSRNRAAASRGAFSAAPITHLLQAAIAHATTSSASAKSRMIGGDCGFLIRLT